MSVGLVNIFSMSSNCCFKKISDPSTIKTENIENIIRLNNKLNYTLAGKTGTVENFILIEGEKKQLTDHSTFIAFAPAEDPKIVVSVFVENGYWGSRWAAPIASLIIEKYLIT